jgi:6-phosphogluconolactonase/glucosamine-6-phosphate isomerase/deaminase
LLEVVMAARGAQRADILRTALLGGADQAQTQAAAVEDAETVTLLDDILAAF